MMYTVTLMPYRVAFEDSSALSWTIIEYLVQCLFGLDIIVCFFSAYYNDHEILIDSIREISVNYVSSWFIIDLIAWLIN